MGWGGGGGGGGLTSRHGEQVEWQAVNMPAARPRRLRAARAGDAQVAGKAQRDLAHVSGLHALAAAGADDELGEGGEEAGAVEEAGDGRVGQQVRELEAVRQRAGGSRCLTGVTGCGRRGAADQLAHRAVDRTQSADAQALRNLVPQDADAIDDQVHPVGLHHELLSKLLIKVKRSDRSDWSNLGGLSLMFWSILLRTSSRKLANWQVYWQFSKL